ESPGAMPAVMCRSPSLRLLPGTLRAVVRMDLRGDGPRVSASVLHASAPVGISCSRAGRLDDRRTRRKRTLKRAVDVLVADVNQRREGGKLWTAIAQHDDRVIDSDLRMHDGAIRQVVASQLDGIEGCLRELDDLLSARDNEVRGD